MTYVIVVIFINNINDNNISLLGVSSVDVLVPYAASINTGSFVGCIGDLQLDGAEVKQAINKFNVKDTCPRMLPEQTTAECNRVCGDDECHGWFKPTCTCVGFYSHQACSNS